jgi:hypothetical protein
MADFNFEPAKSSIAPAPNMSLGDMMNIATQAQALQQARQLNPLQLQAAQQTVEQARQMNPLQLRQQTAVTTGAESKLPFEIRSSEAGAKQAEAGAGSAELKFSSEKLNAIANRQSSLANNPLLVNAEKDPEFAKANAQKISDLFLTYGRTEASNLKIPKEQADQLIQPWLDVAINQPAGSRRFVIERMLAGMDHAARAQIMQPSGVQTSTGAVNKIVSTNIYGPHEPGATIPGTLAIQEPGPTSELIAVEGDGTGLTPGTKYLKGAQGPKPINAPPPGRMVTGNPPAFVQQAPAMIPAGETPETAALAKNIQLKANEAAKGVAQSQANNNQIIGLADNALAGFGAQTIARLGGGFAMVPWTSDATKNRQVLGHYLSLETANLAAGAGLGTDAARGIASQMAGTTEWTPAAIKSTARVNRALSGATGFFAEGVNNAVAANNNSPFAARDFQSKWSTVADVNALRLMDLMKNNDTDGMKSLMRELGGGAEGKQKLEILKLKVSTLNNLIQGKK